MPLDEICPAKYGSKECKAQCERVCLDDHLRPFVDRCCDCDTVCELDESAKVVALAITFMMLLLLAKRRWNWIPVGRAMGCGICAVVTVASPFHILRAEYVLDQPGLFDVNTIATLFGLTIATGCMKDHGVITSFMKLLKLHCSGPRHLMARVIVLTTVLASLVTNDACVIILTQPLIDLCTAMSLPPEPFMIALSTTANLGSAATLIGNPQNVLIAGYSNMNFFEYMGWMLPAVIIGNILNYVFLLIYYRNELKGAFGVSTPRPWPKRAKISVPMGTPLLTMNESPRTPTPAPRTGAVKGEETTTEVQKRMAQEHTAEPSDVLPNVLDQTIETVTPLKLTPPTSELGTPEIMLTLPCGTWPDATRQKVLRTAVAISGFIIIGGFIVLGSIAWTVLMGVGCLVMIDVYIQGGEGMRIAGHADGFLLVMLAGMFVVMGGARRTGVPKEIYDSLSLMCPDEKSWCHYDGKYDSLADVFIASFMVVVLSNLCSNVPTVMLLGSLLQAQQGNPVNKALGWLVLAWSSTVAGNLTLVGSIANLIVAERAAQAGHEITFWNHLKFASWSTLIIIGAGDLILYYFVRPWIEAKLGNEIHQGIALGNGSGFDDVDAYANLTGTGSLSGL